jgi:tripartite-type tricarboxylate transporter receptor subunit TctC
MGIGAIMRLPRRSVLQLAAGAAALPLVSRIARAQTYPTRPIRLIVGFPPGGPTDILARLMARSLSERLHQPCVVENRPGAGSNLATETVVRASPDGYTLLLVAPANAINAALYDKLNFNFIEDIAPVAGIVRVPSVMEVNLSFPAKTVPDFIAYAKANPGKLKMASAGNGSPSHLSAELFKMMAGVDMVHVPYASGPAAHTDLVGGQVQVMFNAIPASIEYIRTGRLRALAVTTLSRSAALPDVPTVGDFVLGYESSVFFGIGAPRNTPAEIIDRLNKEINAGLAEPEMKARFADFGGVAFAESPADFGTLIANETEKWGKVVKFAGIKAD